MGGNGTIEEGPSLRKVQGKEHQAQEGRIGSWRQSHKCHDSSPWKRIVSLLSGSKGTGLGGASLQGGERRQAKKGRESLPTGFSINPSEEGLISAIAVYCHGMPCTGLRFRKQEGLKRWYRLINKASLITGMAVSERKVGGLSVWLICPLGPPAPGRAVMPPDTFFLFCHLTRYHPGHELAGVTRACQVLCRYGVHYQLVV